MAWAHPLAIIIEDQPGKKAQASPNLPGLAMWLVKMGLSQIND
jgi:hypothetical protein